MSYLIFDTIEFKNYNFKDRRTYSMPPIDELHLYRQKYNECIQDSKLNLIANPKIIINKYLYLQCK